jgi:hypothetical protein
MAQHKWHKEIKAWADGAEIEVCKAGTWYGTDYPNFHDSVEFRIKPRPKEPQYLYVYKHEGDGISFGYKPHGALNMWQTKVIGKIKLEVDDAM